MMKRDHEKKIKLIKLKHSAQVKKKVVRESTARANKHGQSIHLLEQSLKGIVSPPFPLRSEKCRINRYLAAAGYGARRKVEKSIIEGRVRINGVTIRSLDVRVNPGDLVMFDGKLVSLPQSAIYMALNKPAGYTVSSREFPGNPAIYQLLPEHFKDLKYAGRLDKESRGLVVLSNDGNFIKAVTHPSHRLTKRYRVTLNQLADESYMFRAFYRGIEDRGDLLRAIRLTTVNRARCEIDIVLGQGKNRQIRRMFAAFGIDVLDIFRTAIGFLDMEINPIKEGEFVLIKPEDIFYGQEYRKSGPFKT